MMRPATSPHMPSFPQQWAQTMSRCATETSHIQGALARIKERNERTKQENAAYFARQDEQMAQRLNALETQYKRARRRHKRVCSEDHNHWRKDRLSVGATPANSFRLERPGYLRLPNYPAATRLREDQQRRERSAKLAADRQRLQKDMKFDELYDPEGGAFQAYAKSREDLAAAWRESQGKEAIRKTSFVTGHTKRVIDKGGLYEAKRMRQREMAREKLKARILEQGSLQKVFAMFDKDGDGTISPKEFKRGLCLLGMGLLAEDSNDMMEHIDKNGDKKISMDELRDFLRKF